MKNKNTLTKDSLLVNLFNLTPHSTKKKNKEKISIVKNEQKYKHVVDI